MLRDLPLSSNRQQSRALALYPEQSGAGWCLSVTPGTSFNNGLFYDKGSVSGFS